MTTARGIVIGTPIRLALDRIRRELGMDRQKNPCPECGDERWTYDRKGVGHPTVTCETCGGKRVRAANLLRAIIGHARQGLLGKSAGLGDRRPERAEDIERRAGIVESVPPLREMGA